MDVSRSRFGRTTAEADDFYEQTRKELAKTITLLDKRDPTYKPLLRCNACKATTRHEYMDTADGNATAGNGTIILQRWRCSCGEYRTWGNGRPV